MTGVSRVLCFLVMAGVLQGGQGFADETGPRSNPHRVRVTAPGFAHKPIVGTLLAIDDETITIRRPGADDVAVPAQAVTRFEVRRPASGRRKGAGIGGLTGLAAGAVLGFAAGEDCGAPNAPSLVCFDRGTTALAAGLTGGLIGAAIGAIVAPRERWHAVAPESVRVGISPVLGRHRRIGMLVTVSF